MDHPFKKGNGCGNVQWGKTANYIGLISKALMLVIKL